MAIAIPVLAIAAVVNAKGDTFLQVFLMQFHFNRQSNNNFIILLICRN